LVAKNLRLTHVALPSSGLRELLILASAASLNSRGKLFLDSDGYRGSHCPLPGARTSRASSKPLARPHGSYPVVPMRLEHLATRAQYE
jgi:hypothetical protein